MKLLIPYDGSKNSDIALNDLRKAGLTENHQALLSITDVWLPSSPIEFSQAISERQFKVFRMGATSYSPALKKTEEQKALLREAGRKILAMFPEWYVQTETLPGVTLASNEILQKAEKWKADLIFIGSGSSLEAENSYGTGALKVAREANCSVRIARGKELNDEAKQSHNLPARIILALDGSADNDAEIIQAVANRNWANGSEVLIATIDKQSSAKLKKAASVGSFGISVGEKNFIKYPEFENEKSGQVRDLAEKLRANGLAISIEKPEGDSPFAIVETARRWKADCIFINGNRYSAKETFPDVLVEALLRRATCSVELVRRARWAEKAMCVAA